ncbi:hypothetical protein BD560DRAFT_386945 [Blakeslea trispora]|nr:hypothetical protein BD560DRAFT_386945 [Blakeslea trispora]
MAELKYNVSALDTLSFLIGSKQPVLIASCMILQQSYVDLIDASGYGNLSSIFTETATTGWQTI